MPDQGSAPSNEFTSPGLRRGAAHDFDRRDTPPETEGGSVAGGPKRGGAERNGAGRAGRGGVGAVLLDGIEWLGNKLPDPAVLFLIMALLVLGLSGVVAPRLPEGFRIEWNRDLTDRPDERTPAFVHEETGEAWRFVAAEGADGSLEAHLVVGEGDAARPYTDEAGRPIDFRGRGWVVFEKRPVEVANPETGKTELVLVPTGRVEVARSLVTSEGLYWALASMVENFMNFAPLGVVLVGILGIGVAERTGLIAALLRAFMLVVPRRLLTPTMVFLGIMSSIGSDAGYIVLPPLAALIYLAAGRSPLAGIAAVFAGVAAGFNANLLITTLEPIMANLTTQGAQVIDPGRTVVATASWWFMIASTFVITGAGWFTTAVFVERRLSRNAPEDGGPDPARTEPPGPNPWTPKVVGAWVVTLVGIAAGVGLLVAGLRAPRGEDPSVLGSAGLALALLSGVGGISYSTYLVAARGLNAREATGTLWAMAALTGIPGLVAALVLLPDIAPAIEETPLYGSEGITQRWVAAVVPIIFLTFIVPGVIYGAVVGTLRNTKDAAKLMVDSIAGVAPIIVLAFFAGQFVAYFGESNVGRMLAYAGGEWLFEQDMKPWLLVLAFIGVTMVFNLFVGSMSAKYALFAPIFVPMFMLIGIRPELTMVAYRIGDSVTNVITPLNAYLVIILVFMQRHAPRAGMGTLISMMLPYSIVFAIAWSALLMGWMALDLELGVGDPRTVYSSVSPEAHPAP